MTGAQQLQRHWKRPVPVMVLAVLVTVIVAVVIPIVADSYVQSLGLTC